MPTELDTLTAWVAVMAVATAVQTLLLVGAVVAGWVTWRRAMSTLDTLEQRHIAPISARVSAVVDDIHDVTLRIRNVDDAVKHRLQEVGGVARVAKDVLADRIWPALGVARALSAGLRALARPAPSYAAGAAPSYAEGPRPGYADQARMGRAHSR